MLSHDPVELVADFTENENTLVTIMPKLLMGLIMNLVGPDTENYFKDVIHPNHSLAQIVSTMVAKCGALVHFHNMLDVGFITFLTLHYFNKKCVEHVLPLLVKSTLFYILFVESA